jgi:hypothetical protein
MLAALLCGEPEMAPALARNAISQGLEEAGEVAA